MEHLLSCNRKNPGKMKIIITPIVIPLKSFNVLNSFMKTASPIANMKKTIVAVTRKDFVILSLDLPPLIICHVASLDGWWLTGIENKPVIAKQIRATIIVIFDGSYAHSKIFGNVKRLKTYGHRSRT